MIRAPFFITHIEYEEGGGEIQRKGLAGNTLRVTYVCICFVCVFFQMHPEIYASMLLRISMLCVCIFESGYLDATLRITAYVNSS